MDDWWSGGLFKRAFSPKTGIFRGHSGPAAIDKNGNVIDLKFGVYNGRPWMFRKDNGQPYGPATKGGALRRPKVTTQDKIAYILSNFVTPAPSFGAAAKILANQAFKGVKDNIEYYKGGSLDIQKQLAKLGELHLRTPTGKKYNYCGQVQN